MSIQLEGKAELLDRFPTAPRRVISLVPSTTESLFELGLGPAIVGVTDYCLHPTERVEALPKVGGTKNPRLEAILALEPDLVLANQEENTPEPIQAILEAGIPVYLAFPTGVSEALADLQFLAELFQDKSAFQRVVTLERAVDWQRQAARETHPVRYFCPIWQARSEEGKVWWMTFNRETFASDLLSLFGGENVFAGRQRRYPLEADINRAPAQDPQGRDVRYPRVTADEVVKEAPALILLPDEPYAFETVHLAQFQTELAETPAVKEGSVRLVDGSLITWHGTRMARALRQLPELLNPE